MSNTPCSASGLAIAGLTAPSDSGVSVSGTPATHIPTARTPFGPSSCAKARISVSMAASAGHVPPISGLACAEPLFSARITPDPCSAMRRPAARAVMKLVVMPLVTGAV